MTHWKARILAVASTLAWVLGLLVPIVGRDVLAIEALILVDMLVLSAAITCTVLTVIVKALPPVAAAWFLGYREAVSKPEKGDGRRLRAVGS